MKRYIKSSVRIVKELNSYEKEDILTDTNASSEILDELVQDSLANDNFGTLRKLLVHPNLPDYQILTILGKLAQLPYNQIPSAFIEANLDNYAIMYYLATHGHKSVQLDLAANKGMMPTILDILANSEYSDVRVKVAKNPNIAEDTILLLAKDTDYEVQHTILNDHPTEKAILTILDAATKSTYSYHDIYRDVCDHYNWIFNIHQGEKPTKAILLKLATSTDKYVRDDVADWAKEMALPHEVLELLVNDESTLVRERLSECADFRNISEDIRIQLAADPDEDVRENVAKYLLLPEDTYMQLANDESRHVRINLLKNTYVPVEIYEYLLNDTEPKIRRLAEKRLNELQEGI